MEHRLSSTLSPPWRFGIVGILSAAVIAGLAVWSLARLLGVDIEAEQNGELRTIGPAEVAFAALVGGLLAWAVHWLLDKSGHLNWWPIVGSTALAISIIGPSYLADGSSAVALIAMHFAVAVVLIFGLSRVRPRNE